MKIEVSFGEIIDKVTILEIKAERLGNKKPGVRNELQYLRDEVAKEFPQFDWSEALELSKVNRQLWDIEDSIREKESLKEFDEDFIKLARSVYITNDKRSAIKASLNLKYNSKFFEEKIYKRYD